MMSNSTYMALVERNVTVHDWHAQGVFPTAGGPEMVPWLYTVGLARASRMPELVVTGLPAKAAHGVVSGTITRLERGDFGVPRNYAGIMDGVLHGLPVFLRPVHETREPEFFGVALADYGFGHGDLPGHVAFSQIVLPDRWGRFPWQDGVEMDFARGQLALDRPTGSSDA